MDLSGAAAKISAIDSSLLDKEYSYGGDSKTLLFWLEEGAKLEDAGSNFALSKARFKNHFHNPLAILTPPIGTLTDGGLKDIMTGQSTLFWAQDSSNQVNYEGGDWSWNAVRDHYYHSLTETDKVKKDEFTVKTYLGLGYHMNLLQDMSQPDHVRNDAHPIDGSGFLWGFETWARKKRPFIQQQAATATNATKPTVDLTQPLYDGYAPVGRLMDTRRYVADRTPSATTNQGLAEYTNANFFSDDTIFAARYATDDKHYFPYPRKQGTDIQNYFDGTKAPETVLSEDKKNVKGLWISKTGVEGEAVPHLVRVGAAADLAYAVFGEGKLFYAALGRDEITYEDYARILVPKAVGYSAALLDYFFRGKLKLIVATPEDITFRSIKVTVQNDTTDEAMASGDVSLVIRYKALTETDLGGGKYLLNNPPEGTSTSDYTYKVTTLNNVNMANSQVLTFTFTDDPLPMNFSDMTMQLVYKGKLGNETDSVAVSPLTTIDGIYTDFNLSLPASGVFAKVSGDSTNASFNELRVTALSNNPGGLSGGTISLALEYRTAVGDQFQSVLVNTEPENAAGYIIRKEEKNGVTTLAQGVPTELVFDLSSTPIPVNATDITLNLVYTDNATSKVSAVAVHDISEPTPVDVYNNTDYSCLNSTWYKYDDPAAMAIVDSNNDGKADRSDIYPHTISNISFLAGPAGSTLIASPQLNNLFASGPLPPGQTLRMGYILTEYDNKFTFNETRTPLDANDNSLHISLNTNYPGRGFQNDGDTQNMMYNFRTYKMWSGEGVIFINTEYNGSCTFDALNQKLGL